MRKPESKARPLPSRRLFALALLALVVSTGCERAAGPALRFEERPRAVAPQAARDPQLLVRASGSVAVLAVEPAASGGADLRLHVSPSRGDLFQPGPRINRAPGSVRSHGEGMPILLEAPGGKFYAVWLGRRAEGKRGNVIRVARSDDFLRSFGPPVELGAAPGPGPAFFDATVSPEGTVIVSWLGEGPGDSLPGSSHVLVSSSTDQARTFSAPVSASTDVCPCCRPGLGADKNGRWYLAWRAMDALDIRDLVIAASSDQGRTWSTAQAVPGPSWKIDGCPHSGPSLEVNDGTLYAAWYTEATGQSRLYWSKSDDGARTFAGAEDIAGDILDPNHPQLAVIDGEVFVTFQGRDPVAEGSWGRTRPFVRALGPPGDVQPVGVPAGAGTASYPVLSGLGAGRLIVAWTDSGPEGSSILAARGRTNAPAP